METDCRRWPFHGCELSNEAFSLFLERGVIRAKLIEFEDARHVGLFEPVHLPFDIGKASADSVVFVDCLARQPLSLRYVCVNIGVHEPSIGEIGTKGGEHHHFDVFDIGAHGIVTDALRGISRALDARLAGFGVHAVAIDRRAAGTAAQKAGEQAFGSLRLPVRLAMTAVNLAVLCSLPHFRLNDREFGNALDQPLVLRVHP